MYSKYAGTEVEYNNCKHLIMKEDDIIGILESDDVKDMKPLNDRVLIKVFIFFTSKELSRPWSYVYIGVTILIGLAFALGCRGFR